MHRIYVDTNIFIGAFDADNETSREIINFFEAYEALPQVLVTSELTLAEVGVKDQQSLNVARSLPILSLFIDFIAITQSILLETCKYRIELRQSGRQMKLPDAIHCVTAIESKGDFVFSGDKRLWLPEGMERIGPDQSGFSMLRAFLDA